MMDLQYHKDYLGFSQPDTDLSVFFHENGQMRGGLFHEISPNPDNPPLYTMRERPFRGSPSAYLIYMYSDTEYEAAMKLFGSWQLWERWLKNAQFLDGPHNPTRMWTGVSKWREEKKLQDEARAFSQLREAAEIGNVQAMKTLWDIHNKPKRGRPSKDEVSKAADQAAKDAKRIKDDLKTIKLATVNGKER